MAKSTNKPPKRREQPWMAAARAKLHKGAPAPQQPAPGWPPFAADASGAPPFAGARSAPEPPEPPEPGAPTPAGEPVSANVYIDRSNWADLPPPVVPVAEAFLAMTAPEFEAIRQRQSLPAIEEIVDCALFVYNEAVNARTPSFPMVQQLNEMTEMMRQSIPGFRQRFDRMAKVRRERFGHVMTVVMMAMGRRDAAGRTYIQLMISPKE
jgi:hypothetical protein